MKEILSKNDFLKAYDEYADDVFRFCYFKTSNREVALDLAQDTFMKTWQYIANGQEISQAKPFLFKTANNLIIDYYRKKKSESLDNLTEAGLDWKDDKALDIEKRLESEDVLKVANQLEEKYKEAFLMKFVHDLDIEEIAEIVGEEPGNVSVRIHRAIKKIRKIIEKNE